MPPCFVVQSMSSFIFPFALASFICDICEPTLAVFFSYPLKLFAQPSSFITTISELVVSRCHWTMTKLELYIYLSPAKFEYAGEV
ncbi:hypothetical protein M405DRAFT_421120 [Rhizopogon salebrosus TDB-379]|nr:hypothetical protein M405DRAFT_421120 [Rhizopogon salebrosus TDB-379]